MDLLTLLRQRLAEHLPGPEAHRLMLPDDPSFFTRLQPPPATARACAVLVPLILHEDVGPDVLFTLRSTTLRNHGGQISFPGGRLEEGEDAETAAVRELFEETGVVAKDVTVLGRLSPLYIPPSNSAVTPIVALLHTIDTYHPSAEEVNEIFTVPIARFLDTSVTTFVPGDQLGRNALWPMWSVHSTVPLWGATAMILSELIWLLREQHA